MVRNTPKNLSNKEEEKSQDSQMQEVVTDHFQEIYLEDLEEGSLLTMIKDSKKTKSK